MTSICHCTALQLSPMIRAGGPRIARIFSRCQLLDQFCLNLLDFQPPLPLMLHCHIHALNIEEYRKAGRQVRKRQKPRFEPNRHTLSGTVRNCLRQPRDSAGCRWIVDGTWAMLSHHEASGPERVRRMQDTQFCQIFSDPKIHANLQKTACCQSF